MKSFFKLSYHYYDFCDQCNLNEALCECDRCEQCDKISDTLDDTIRCDECRWGI